ncbi:retrotransposon protein, putative, ty1-copia subclass [Tanacetum coccineum]
MANFRTFFFGGLKSSYLGGGEREERERRGGGGEGDKRKGECGRIVLSIEDKLNYLEQPIPPAPVALEGQQVAPEIIAAHYAWIKISKEIDLKTLFAQQAEQELLQTVREFHSCKQKEGQSVSSYVLKMKGYIDNLEHLGHPVSLNLGVSLILISLRKEFDSFLPNYNMHNMGRTINELHAMLKLHEQTLPKNNVPALHAIRAGKIWHWKRNFPQYLAELLKNKKLSQGASGSVSRNNMVYFIAIPRDGIFEIDLSDSYTNVSSMYALSNKRAKSNLDSALLWHCCLGHISKKRIKKLQHDGLLNSTDLRAFEKCVPCMSGKMARKPYTHQVERAKDLLGLKHHRCQTTLPKSFWDYALETAARILNMVPTKKVEKTPYEVWHGQAPKLLITQEASGSLEDLEIIQEEDTHPSIDTSLHHEEDDLEIDEPQSDIIPIRRSTRTRHAPDRMCLYIDAEEHELGDLGEPANYKAALLDPESDKWLNAMNVKMQSIKDNKVWDLVNLPLNEKTIGSKWLFKKKTDMDGAVHTYKARLVAMGYTQSSMIDYEETFSLVAYIRAIRILLAIAVFYDYEIWQMDVKITFHNEYLSEEVYMEQPEGFVNPKYQNRVCKLKRSIYGLKQASRQWNKRFDDEIKKFGFTQNRDEPCVYLKASRSNVTFLILYVDDILIMGNNIPMLQDVKSYLEGVVAMKDCRFQQNPGDLYWTTVKNILKYLRNTEDMFLTGYVFILNGGVVDWKSAKQSIFATSSTGTKYIATYDASKEAVWVRKFIFGLGIVPTIEETINMYCDNTGAITIANEFGITKGARHFRAKVHYLREVIEFGDIRLEKVHTDDNLADPFTKALAFPKHLEHTMNIGILPASSLM